MKNLFMFFACVLFSINIFAQADKSKMPSPPAQLEAKIGKANISIKYHQPAVKGRSVWNSESTLAPYGKVWRTGANNATTFETNNDIMIEDKLLPKGKYALFTIPGEKEWTIIFNSKSAQWGNYSYKQKEDVLRVTVAAGKSEAFNERFTIANEGDSIVLLWENVKTSFSIK